MQPIDMIMIYYWNMKLNKKKKKKRLHVLEADIITIKKQSFDVSSSKNTWRIPNDRHCACLIVIILMGCIYFETPCITISNTNHGSETIIDIALSNGKLANDNIWYSVSYKSSSSCRRKWTRRYEFKSWTRLIAFHIALIPLEKVWVQLFSLQLWVNSRTD